MRVSKAIKNLEKTVRRSKIISSPAKINIKIPISTAAVSTAGAPTGALSTHRARTVEVDDYVELRMPLCFGLGQGGFLV